VYCRKVDEDRINAPFHVDHYKPQRLFGHLTLEYSNLFYACSVCNKFKHQYWPSDDEAAQKIFIPNPCDHVMFEHLRYSAATVVSRTRAGEWTVERLRLNSPNSVDYRGRRLKLLAYWNRVLAESRQNITKWEKAAKKQTDVGQVQKLRDLIDAAQRDLILAESELELYGPPIVPDPPSISGASQKPSQK
jgi:5-methylcytosine-specific restriction endonuclease McrA